MPGDSPKKLLTRYSIPEGTWEQWDPETRAEAEHTALLFAQEYCKDYSSFNAACRLGANFKSAQTIGNKLVHHWLVLQKIDEIAANFRKEVFCTTDTVMSLLYRDASNYAPKANAMARVTAQKCLAQALGLLAAKEEEGKKTSTTINAQGGVMVVSSPLNADAWGLAAEKQQEKLKAEVRE